MSIPNWLQGYLEEKDLASLRDSITRAESHTAGEIVPLVVRRSISTGHVPFLAFLILAFLLLGLAAQSVGNDPHAWIYQAISVVTAFAVAWALRSSDIVSRWLTPHHDQAAQVMRRAQLEFYQTGIPHTAGRTGVLIFVSMTERHAVVLGDEAIAARVKPEQWDAIIRDVVTHFKRQNFREGLEVAIGHAGELLAREFPAQAHDTNELPNDLVIKE